MSRIDELKKQYKEFALSDLDIMKMVVPNQASKYVEVLAKLTKNHIESSYSGSYSTTSTSSLRTDILQSLVNNYDLDYNYLETLETTILLALYLRADALLGSNRAKLFTKFANLNERGLVTNNDITSYKTFDEIEAAVSLAEMKLIDKELEKQILKIYEDDEWLLLKPLSLEASMKYGSNTKWCTTMESGRYFANYSKWGILIYALNKKTGYKFASFKNLDNNRDKEFSFWNPADSKIDPLDTLEIPTEILSIIRKEINTNPVSNTCYMSEPILKKLDQYLEEQGTLRFTTTVASTGNGITVTPNYFNVVSGSSTTYVSEHMAEEQPSEPVPYGGRIQNNPYSDMLEQTQREMLERASNEMFSEVERQLIQAQERAVEQREQEAHIGVLRDIELGTLDERYIKRMQQLAGIDTTKVMTEVISGLNELTAETESLQAELTGVPSQQPVNWFNKLKNKIKNGYERITTKKDIQQPSMESHSDVLGGASGY